MNGNPVTAYSGSDRNDFIPIDGCQATLLLNQIYGTNLKWEIIDVSTGKATGDKHLFCRTIGNVTFSKLRRNI